MANRLETINQWFLKWFLKLTFSGLIIITTVISNESLLLLIKAYNGSGQAVDLSVSLPISLSATLPVSLSGSLSVGRGVWDKANKLTN